MLGARIVTAAVLAAVFIGALFAAPRPGWWLFCAAGLALAAWEWARLARLHAAWNPAFTALLVGLFAALDWGAPAGWHRALYAAATVLWLVGGPLWLWRRPGNLPPALLAAAGAVVLVPAFLALMDLRDQSVGLLLAVMAVVWISDTAAFCVGRKFGRRKLAPAISPGKTWEGVCGALAAVVCYGAVWATFPTPAQPPAVPEPRAAWLAMTALALAVMGIVGDLFESHLKRSACVKDSGRLLPGHGGVLDRIDALLPVLPAAAWVFAR